MSKHQGFTLIEVLVAMLLLSGGLLGFAALQGVSLKNNQLALQNSLATELSYDLADRMRGNRSAALSYLNTLPANAAQQPACMTTTGCTPAQLVLNDLYEWNLALSVLPLGTGSISAPGGNVFTITIAWDSNRDGVVDGGVEAGGQDNVYTMSFYL
ncbi:MAG: type IV pilus modification protein PilV [Methylovulum sp.]|nr:type IV pilus modification protein PilV [Methylovulum sp.]